MLSIASSCPSPKEGVFSSCKKQSSCLALSVDVTLTAENENHYFVKRVCQN